MGLLVSDTSALVSLGTVADRDPNPLDELTDIHSVLVPTRVVGELRETAAYEDPSGDAARAVLDRSSELDERGVRLDTTFPLDDGENAAVSLANETDANALLCDEFNELGLVHASLTDTRLLTTPVFLATLVRNDVLATDEATRLVQRMSDARSWEGNSYVERARHTLQRL